MLEREVLLRWWVLGKISGCGLGRVAAFAVWEGRRRNCALRYTLGIALISKFREIIRRCRSG